MNSFKNSLSFTIKLLHCSKLSIRNLLFWLGKFMVIGIKFGVEISTDGVYYLRRVGRLDFNIYPASLFE